MNILTQNYDLLGKPLQGGMGQVYHLFHRQWGVDIALKRPLEKFLSTGQGKLRFQDECRKWISLGIHPNVVQCFYVQELDGTPCVISEWADGGDLSTLIKDEWDTYSGEDRLRILLSVAIQTGTGLYYAHKKGLLHLDIKPTNILVDTNGLIKITDFGISQTLREARSGATGGRSGYTPRYCAPEQKFGQPVGKYTDVYCWAVTMLHLILGDAPWQDGTVPGYASSEYLMTARDPLPKDLRALLISCLSPEPSERPQQFAPILKELLRIWQQVTGSAFSACFLDYDGDNADAMNNQALSYIAIGDRQKADRLLEDALKKEPGHITARHNLALSRYLHDRRILPWRETAKNQSKTAEPEREYYLYAKGALSSGAYERAALFIQEAKRLAPKDRDILALEGRIEKIARECGPVLIERFKLPRIAGREFDAGDPVLLSFLEKDKLLFVTRDGVLVFFNGEGQVLSAAETNFVGLTCAAVSSDRRYLALGRGRSLEEVLQRHLPGKKYKELPGPEYGEVRLYDIEKLTILLRATGCDPDLTALGFEEKKSHAPRLLAFFRGAVLDWEIQQEYCRVYDAGQALRSDRYQTLLTYGPGARTSNVVSFASIDSHRYLVAIQESWKYGCTLNLWDSDTDKKVICKELSDSSFAKDVDRCLSPVPGKHYVLFSLKEGGYGVCNYEVGLLSGKPGSPSLRYPCFTEDRPFPLGEDAERQRKKIDDIFRCDFANGIPGSVEPFQKMAVSPDGSRMAFVRDNTVDIRRMPDYTHLPEPQWEICRFRNTMTVLETRLKYISAANNIRRRVEELRVIGITHAGEKDKEYLLKQLEIARENRENLWEYLELNAALSAVLPIRGIKSLKKKENAKNLEGMDCILSKTMPKQGDIIASTADGQIKVQRGAFQNEYLFFRTVDNVCIFRSNLSITTWLGVGFTRDNAYLVDSGYKALFMPEWIYSDDSV